MARKISPVLLVVPMLVACGPSLEGKWDGKFDCNTINYDIEYDLEEDGSAKDAFMGSGRQFVEFVNGDGQPQTNEYAFDLTLQMRNRNTAQELISGMDCTGFTQTINNVPQEEPCPANFFEYYEFSWDPAEPEEMSIRDENVSGSICEGFAERIAGS